MKGYDHKRIEKRWQKEWEKKKLYKTPDKVKGKKNHFLLVEFPYPSGNLHVGHWYAFSVPDILARTLRMMGKNVLYPIGFDAFGLPAENAAIKNKINPRKWTEKNIAYMKNQIRSMGTMFDWSREVSTIDPAYYKWTQWQFLQFFKKGLTYRKETAVNWCPSCKTVLANEQVIDGKCERCKTEVVQKNMLQWNMRITKYADRLVDDLERLDWPEQIKESQRNWIGRSEGAEIDFPLRLNGDKKYTYVFLHGFTGSPDVPRFKYWKAELEKDGHTVIAPKLPHTDKPSEKEQLEAALKAAKYDGNTVLFGHSLGAPLAMKVVERLKTPIARLVLAGGFTNPEFKDKRRPFEKTFAWEFDGAKIRKNVKTIQILHDPNDYAVTGEQRKKLEDLLEVKAIIIEGEEPHFTGEKELPILRWLRPTINVFTTRADTLYGAMYMVLAPEHALIEQLKPQVKNWKEVSEYVVKAGKKTELERQTEQKEKTGVELKGIQAINPATGKEIPVWVSDFVLAGYGTGALMAVPAHDERDFEFAKKFSLPVVEVVEPVVVLKTGLDGVHPNEPIFERQSVFAFAKHWSEDKYLAVRYLPTSMNECVSGGIEAGEDPIDTGKREIREETGYSNAQFLRKVGGTVHGQYYSIERQRNTLAHYQVLEYKLVDGTREEVAEHERVRHEVSWLTPSEMSAFINREEVRIAWERVQGNNIYTGEGMLASSGEFSGISTEEARTTIAKKFGKLKTTYKMRDWVVSRQRYWGVPIPIIHCPKCGEVAVPDKDLPVKLPDVRDYLPDGRGKSPLAKATKWVNVKCPQCKGKAERETDTLDTFVDSSWYFLRYTDPKNAKKFADPKRLADWMPVHLYSGGAEHTTMHVLYSRFWQKALYDLNLVKDKEPYTRRMNRSLILGPDGQKMSKSRGNVIDPDEVVARLGADTVRMYLAFIGPYNEVSNYPWNPDGVVGIRRFLERVRRDTELVTAKANSSLDPILHKTIKKATEDIPALKFNTAISQLMIFLNAVEKEKTIGKEQWKVFLRLLAPFAPHMAEELWSETGSKKSVHLEQWPSYKAALLKEETVKIGIQVNGKTRGEVEVPYDASKEEQEKAARKAVAERLDGKEVIRTIVVPGRLVNFVVKE